MKVLGNLSACIELDNSFRLADILVVDVEKNFGLLGGDMLQVKTVSIHNTATTLGCLKGYEAKIRLTENAAPCFSESRPLPIYIKPLVVAEIKRMERDGILEVVPEGGSEWASPIVCI